MKKDKPKIAVTSELSEQPEIGHVFDNPDMPSVNVVYKTDDPDIDDHLLILVSDRRKDEKIVNLVFECELLSIRLKEMENDDRDLSMLWHYLRQMDKDGFDFSMTSESTQDDDGRFRRKYTAYFENHCMQLDGTIKMTQYKATDNNLIQAILEAGTKPQLEMIHGLIAKHCPKESEK
jgi:hypothetical protein